MLTFSGETPPEGRGAFPRFVTLAIEEKAVAYANYGVQWGIADEEKGA